MTVYLTSAVWEVGCASDDEVNWVINMRRDGDRKDTVARTGHAPMAETFAL